MRGEEAIHQLSQLRPSDASVLKSLARQIEMESLEAPAAIVDAWLTKQEDLEGNALFIMIGLKELAIRPMIQRMGSATLMQRQLLAEKGATALRQLRRRILLELDRLVNGDTDSGSPAAQFNSSEASNYRVCDEAYLLIRRLINMDISPQYQSRYQGLDKLERNAEIAGWKRSVSRQCLLGIRAIPGS